MRGAWIVLLIVLLMVPLMVPLMVSEGAGECLEGAGRCLGGVWGSESSPGVTD